VIVNQICRYQMIYGLLREFAFANSIGFTDVLEKCTCIAPPQSKHQTFTHPMPDNRMLLTAKYTYTKPLANHTFTSFLQHIESIIGCSVLSSLTQFEKVKKSSPRRHIPPKTNARWEKAYSLQPYMWRHSSRASALGQINAW
jgi:hypothetical protein